MTRGDSFSACLLTDEYYLDTMSMQIAVMPPEEDNQDTQVANEDHRQIPAVNGAQQEDEEEEPFLSLYTLLLQENNNCVDGNLMSKILYNRPGKLSYSARDDLPQSKVFWTRTSSPILVDENEESIKEKMKSALQSIEAQLYQPSLAQLWALDKDGDQLFLSTSHLPFGLQDVCIRLLRYRKRCLRYKYSIDDGDNGNETGRFGPPGRVFRSGVPEIKLWVGSYTTHDYPLLDFAVSCGVQNYLAIPVFESPRGKQRCVAVLEVVSSVPIFTFTTSVIDPFAQALKVAGLWSLDFFLVDDLQFYVEEVTHAAGILKEGLKMVCEAHDLPYSQIWAPSGVTHDGKELLSSINISYMQDGKYISFWHACQQSHLRSGEGVVGKAHLSCKAWFCEDITQLSMNEYFPTHNAREVNLTSCFAIGLQDFAYVYIAEFFLPNWHNTTCRQPWTSLDSLLSTIKHHFERFKVFPIEGKWVEELCVEAITRFSKDSELSQSTLCETEALVEEGCYSQNDKPNKQLGVDVTARAEDSINPEQITAASTGVEEIPPNVGGGMQLSPPHQILSLNVDAIKDREENDRGPKQTDSVVIPLDEEVAKTYKITPLDEGVAKTFNWGHNITKEDLEQHVGKKLKDAADSLGVSRSTFKRICRQHEIRRWPSSKRKKVNNSISMANAKRRTVEHYVRDKPHFVSTPDERTASDANPMPQVTTVQYGRSITIKAKYKTDMIKFELSLSATMMELMGKVAKKFELQADMFKAKYLDKDKDWILLTDDDELHECMRFMRSVGRENVYILVEPKI